MKSLKGNAVDLFLEGKFDILIHGCNCCRAMASGIAGEIALKIPEAVLADNLYGLNRDIAKLGNWSHAQVRRIVDGKVVIGTVINLYTQFLPGPDLYEEALILGFKKLESSITYGRKICIPEIGCGIAGGDWSIIGPRIASIMKKHDLTHIEFINNEKKRIEIETS